ncbi:MAG: hypothetical protein KDD62_04350, partial [Bdellovibrionales bacterium]|nr:hypothetical protein [Bdellovibrionales bacterium]
MKLAYRWLISILIFIIICSGSGFSEEQTFVPDDLSSWVNWVKQRNPNWQCANVEGAMLCVWPGRFEYKLNDRNGIFKLFVEVLDTSDVQLPSSSALYPFNIEIKDSDEKAIKATLQRKSNQLFVKLPKGTFTITGEFQWDKIPTELPLPSLYGLFELTHNGHNVNFRRGEQSVWIEDKEAGKEAEQLTISVFRKIIDTSPMQIDTLIRLRVSGTNRALNLGKVILPGTTPVKSESALPHYLSNDGSLGLQLIPGQHELLVTSIASQPISSLQTPALALPEWPKEEIWSFVANEAFRSVNVSGASPVQASLTQLPEDWHAGATFVVQGADTVTFNLLRRGEHTLAANSINLEREIWTDLDGSGF